MSKKIKIDEEKCIGCGLCAELAPKNFEMRGDKAIVKKAAVEKADDVNGAVESCAVEAISVS
ncbi:MAG: ferredoxin [Nanoarchaeota archaeon]|nr:ferredoxin [Nanoarchaeota archaeon]MBU1103992.1 ferredoxin [Nanoarchaeota archaeon]